MKLIYFIEEQDRKPRRYYVYYIAPGTMVKTLFDICYTREKAEEAIELHKQGKHPTQWEPGK